MVPNFISAMASVLGSDTFFEVTRRSRNKWAKRTTYTAFVFGRRVPLIGVMVVCQSIEYPMIQWARHLQIRGSGETEVSRSQFLGKRLFAADAEKLVGDGTDRGSMEKTYVGMMHVKGQGKIGAFFSQGQIHQSSERWFSPVSLLQSL